MTLTACLSSILSTILIFVGVAAMLSVPFYLLYLWGKKGAERELAYEFLYEEIERIIEIWPICLTSYDIIKTEFIALNQLKYKNPEKTAVLKLKFDLKYKDIKK
jgi:hypothetical protein